MKSIILGSLLAASQVPTTSLPTYENWGQEKIEAAQVWNQGIKGAGVIIGLVDSGMNKSHPLLQSKIAMNQAELLGQPGVDDDNNGYIDDVDGLDLVSSANSSKSNHASHVAGILVADYSANGVQGLAPEAKLIPVSFIDPENGGSIGDAVIGIEYAIQRGAKIINMSWGGAPTEQPFSKLIANHPDVLFVTEAGNEGSDLALSPSYPAALRLPNLITVGATNISDVYASWSNSGDAVDLAAPGMDILSLGFSNNETYMDGTGMATSFVTGAAALLWSYNPTATVAQIKKALLEGVDVGLYPVQTKGRLNVAKALAVLKAM